MINPIELKGNWTKGFALDIHVIKSVYTGDNEYGHPKFDTKRSKIGELLYQLKYKNNRRTIHDIMNLVKPFLDEWNISSKIDVVIPVPPTDKFRKRQPVFIITENIAKYLDKPFYFNLLEKITTNKVKDMYISDKAKSIKGNIVKKKAFKRKVNLLLIDDLYETGSTLSETCSVLKQDKNTEHIYVLTMTKTKR